jgi:membrane protein YdbS with pleckstrin-like domain
MTPLSPSQKSVFRVRGIIASLVLFAPALAVDLLVVPRTSLPPGLATSLVSTLAFFLIFTIPPRRYRAWGYDETADELHVRQGIWFESRTVVPFGRVQHIDVSQGPVERRYGVGTLTLHTAGTRSSAVALPGLDLEQAERMRDEIRGKIRQDLV